MEPLDKLDERLAVLVLRTVGSYEAPSATKKVLSSQEAVASVLHYGKPKVVEIEHWFRDLPYENAAVACEDKAIKSVAEGLLADLEGMTPTLIKKAGQITSKDILRYYRTDYIQKNKHFIFSPQLQQHWDNLAEAATRLARNLRLVINEEGYIIGNITSGYIYTSGVLDSKDQTPLDRVNRTTAKYLLPHLYAEFPEFETITDWRRLTAKDIKQKISRDMLDNLNLVSLRKTLTGVCKVCESWK